MDTTSYAVAAKVDRAVYADAANALGLETIDGYRQNRLESLERQAGLAGQ